MSALSTTLQALLKHHGITVMALARATNLHQPVIYRIATNDTKNPRIKTLKPIAAFFNITVGQLLGDEPLLFQQDHILSLKDITVLPLMSFEEAGQWLQSKTKGKDCREILVDFELGVDACAINMSGSAMAPLFPDNSVLIMDPSQSCSDQDFVFARVKKQDKLVFRQLFQEGEEQYLKPLNTDFRIIKLTKADEVVGKLVQARINHSVIN